MIQCIAQSAPQPGITLAPKSLTASNGLLSRARLRPALDGRLRRATEDTVMQIVTMVITRQAGSLSYWDGQKRPPPLARREYTAGLRG